MSPKPRGRPRTRKPGRCQKLNMADCTNGDNVLACMYTNGKKRQYCRKSTNKKRKSKVL